MTRLSISVSRDDVSLDCVPDSVPDGSISDVGLDDGLPTTASRPTLMKSVGRALPVDARIVAVVGGVLTAFSIPPFGWWPLAWIGLALLYLAVMDQPVRRRMGIGFLFGLAVYGISLFWMTAFSKPGGVFVAALEAAFTAVGIACASRRCTALTLPAAVILADGLRSLWPFGGLPLGGIDLGQVNGPLVRSVAFGGRLLLVGLTALIGVGLGLLYQRRVRSSVLMLSAIATISVLTVFVPDGTKAGPSRTIAALQGGGPRGTRFSEQGTLRAYQRHLNAAAEVAQPVDLVLWPEDIVDVELFKTSTQFLDIQTIAAKTQAPQVVGVIEDGPPNKAGTRTFFNEAVVVNVDGTTGARFDKVRRVPYGEYFPFRSFLSKFASLPSRDAIGGKTVGFLRTPAGPFAIAISYEGFFDDRTRGGVRAGGQAILVPTNASSFSTSQVPTQQVAAAQLRAIETGRWIVQASPTGRSAVINADGEIVERSVLGEQRVLQQRIVMRTGWTPYVRFNDAPMLVLSVGTLLICFVLSRLFRRKSPVS